MSSLLHPLVESVVTMSSIPFATPEDLHARLPVEDSTMIDYARVKILLQDATDLIIYRCPGWKNAPKTVLTAVTCRVVSRAIRRRPAGVAGDATQLTQTTGPFSLSTSWANPSGDLFLTKQDRDDINGVSASFFSSADTLFGGAQ